MIRHWTRFAGRPYGRFRAEEFRVTMAPKGVIYLNEKAWQALDRPEAVELMFDVNLRIIGLTPTESWRESAFPVKNKSGGHGKMISAAAFCQHFRIRPIQTVMFNDVHVDAEGVMSLPLNSITAVSRGAR